MQAQLPDLNTAWIMDKREFLNSIKNRNYTAVFGSLYAINAALPKDYQITISDQEYYQKTIHDIKVICPNCALNCDHCDTGKGECQAEMQRSKIKIFEVLKNSLIATISDKKTEKVWKCEKCHKTNKLAQTTMIREILPQPSFLQVVPNPPARSGSLIDRNDYHRKVEKWAYLFYDELAYQMSKYRIEYKPKDSENIDEVVSDGGETLDI